MPIEIGKYLFYDLEEASKKMDITIKVLRKWIKDGKLKAKKVGIKYYVTEEQMLDVFKPDDDLKKSNVRKVRITDTEFKSLS